jgi:putative ABC transport system permease protein
MNNLWLNIRFALRQLRKAPVFTLTVVLTLALGIGAITAIYTVVYATLLAPLPYPHPDQLVVVWSKIQGFRNGVSAGDFNDWRQQNSVFQDLVAFSGTSFNMAGKDEPEIIGASLQTPGLFRMVGNRFLMGRDFLPEEGVAGKDQVVILSYPFWKKLGADPHIIGKQITLDQKPYTVVGVMASGPNDRQSADVMAPLVFKPEQLNHDFHWLLVMGRLKPGVTLQQAQANMNTVAAHITEANPKSNKGWGVLVEPLKNDFMGDNTKLTLWLLLGAVGFLLLIACVNVANLLLAKGVTRQKEIAIRSAVGASRRSVFGQFVTESLVMAAIGGIVGVGLGYAMLRGLVAAMPLDTLPSEANVQLSLPVLLVTLGVTTLAGLIFGCAPAWYASRVDPYEALKEGGRTGSSRMRNRLRQLLVVGEFALALTLLAGAGLAIHSFWKLMHIDLGVQTDHVLTFEMPMPKQDSYNSAVVVSHYQQILRSVAAAPGVESASASTGMPLEGPGFGMPFSIVGQPAFTDPSQRPLAGLEMVTPDYYKTFGIRLTKGRAFTDQDNASSLHVAMVNEKLVDQHFRGKDPIGQQLMVEQLIPGVTKLGPAQPWVIVGVFHDVRGGSFDQQRAEIDIPFSQSAWPGAAIGVRTSGDPEAMTKTISAAVHAVDPTVALAHVQTLNQVRDQALSGQRFDLLLYVIFGVIALALAAVGIYGVMAFAVGQRLHEVGIRMALGAGRERVVRMVLREGALMSGAGLVLGLGGAYLVGRAMRSTLYGVSAVDLPAFCAVGALLLVAALVACYFPARRAASIEPMQSLRTE